MATFAGAWLYLQLRTVLAQHYVPFIVYIFNCTANLMQKMRNIVQEIIHGTIGGIKGTSALCVILSGVRPAIQTKSYVYCICSSTI